MTRKQLNGLVDCLANVCTFNTTRDYSLSIQETTYRRYHNARLLVFCNEPATAFCNPDLQQLIGLSEAWNVRLYIVCLHGVPVAKFI